MIPTALSVGASAKTKPGSGYQIGMLVPDLLDSLLQMSQLLLELLHVVVTTDGHSARYCMGLYYPITNLVKLLLEIQGVQAGVGPLEINNATPSSSSGHTSTRARPPKDLVAAELSQVRADMPSSVLQVLSRGRQVLQRLRAAYAEGPKFASAIVPLSRTVSGTPRVPVMSYLSIAADFRRNMKPPEPKVMMGPTSTARAKGSSKSVSKVGEEHLS